MSTVSDLGRAQKLKEPGKYDDLSDAEVGRALKRRYPGKYDDFIDEAIEVRQQPLPPARVSKPPTVADSITSYSYPSSTARRGIDDYLKTLLRTFKADRGRFTAWWQWGKSVSRTELLKSFSEEQILVIEQGAKLEELIRNREKSELDFETFVVQHAVTLQELILKESLIQRAMNVGLPVERYVNFREEELKEEAALNRKLREMQERVRLAIITKSLPEMQKIAFIQDLIDGVYTQIQGIQYDPKLSEETKRRMIEDREEVIAAFKEDRRARQRRLLETDNGRDVRGNDEDTGLR